MTHDHDFLEATPPPPPGLAVAILVLGILALTLAPLLIGGALGIIAVGLGAFFLRSGPRGRRMAAWGTGLGLLGMLIGVGAGALYYHWYREWKTQWASFEHGMDEGQDGEPPSEWVGTRAALTLTTLEGERVELGQFRGRPVVLNFWATWCGACKREQPHLNRLARELPEVVVLGVSDEPESTLKASGWEISYRIASVPAPPPPLDGVASLPTTVFIDKNGVIADVQVGYQGFEALKTRALAASFTGTPREAASAGPDTAVTLEAKERWSAAIENVTALTTCQWEGDPVSEVLVATSRGQLVVLDASGAEKARLALPARTTAIECANHADGTARLLAYQNWGQEVSALDGSGQALWSYRSTEGVNGAHWGDLDGDGQVELVVGMNGAGGLHAASSQGRRLWRAEEIGNVWSQAVVSATTPGGPLVVATEAGGSVRLFDDDGNETANLQPLGDYYTALAAAGIGRQGELQVVAAGRKRVVAFDTQGQVAWQAPAQTSARTWRSGFFAPGDLTGDGALSWVFPVRRRALSVTASDGRRLALVAVAAEPSAFVVLPALTGKGMLVVAGGKAVKAYTLEKTAQAAD